jgi:hypothetical protein
MRSSALRRLAMSRDKHIEEMAKDLCGRADCATCGELMPCFSKHFSKRAVEKGYRKASEVAREIFEEIEEVRMQHTFGNIDGSELNVKLYYLKKKYTEGEG